MGDFIHATQLHEIIICKSIPNFIQYSNRQCTIVVNWELQMKSERKPIKVWSTSSPASYSSQYGMSLTSSV